MTDNVRYDATGDGWAEAADDLDALAAAMEHDGAYDAYNGRGLEELAARIRAECAYDPGGSRTVAVDFDGVVHSYHRGWADGTCYGHPLPGAAEALAELAARYRVVVFTARDSLDDVRRWLEKHGLAEHVHSVTGQKPSAVAYVDDRAVCFDLDGKDGCGWDTVVTAVDALVERKRRRPA